LKCEVKSVTPTQPCTQWSCRSWWEMFIL